MKMTIDGATDWNFKDGNCQPKFYDKTYIYKLRNLKLQDRTRVINLFLCFLTC